MKPILLILCALFFSFTSIAQIPMDSLYRDNTRWINFADYTARTHGSPTGLTNGSVVLEYKISGDSIINNDTFKKLYVKKLYHIMEPWNSPTFQSKSVYIGRLRIDGRKLYYTNDSSIQICYDKSGNLNTIGTEVLIADWGLNIGDTFKAGLYTSGVVKNIYPQTLPSGQTINSYVVYKYNQGFNDTLLEGIGNSGSLFYASCTLPDELGTLTEFKYYNLCFFADGIYYHSDAKSKYMNWYLMQNCFDQSKLGLSNINVSDNNFLIVPNPSNGVFFIKGIAGSAQTSINVYNNLGQQIFTKTINGNNINTEIQLNNSTPGIYTISIRSGDIVKHEKLIVQ